jgi:hypothetical protein
MKAKVYIDEHERLRLDVGGQSEIPLLGGSVEYSQKIELIEAIREACEEFLERESQEIAMETT